MRRKTLGLLLWIAMALLLTGCLFRPPDELYRRPERSAGYDQLAAAIRSVKTGLEGQFGVSCEDAVIVAFEMAPMSVRIAGLSLKKAGNGRHLGRGPMMILSENGKVVEEPIKKSFLSALNFI